MIKGILIKQKVLMRYSIRFFHILFFIFIPEVLVNAQDPVFSQYSPTYLYQNPGFAGISYEKRFSMTYRNQWPGSLTKFETFYASYDQPIEVLHGGIGFNIFNDRTGKGMTNNFHVSAIYSYHLRVSKEFYIQAGFQVSVNQRNINHDMLVFQDMLNPSGGGLKPTMEVLGEEKKMFMDYSVGFTGYGGNWFGGFAVFHLTEPIQSESGNEDSALPRKYTIYLARNIFLSGSPDKTDSWVVTPHINVQEQKSYQYLSYGLTFNKNQIYTGISVRNDFQLDFTSLIFSFGFSNLLLNIAYSYDVYIGDRTKLNPSGGAHEISMSVRLPYNKIKTKAQKTINLPVF